MASEYNRQVMCLGVTIENKDCAVDRRLYLVFMYEEAINATWREIWRRDSV